MQPNPSLARLLLIPGLFLLMAVPIFLAGVKTAKKHKLENIDSTSQLDSVNNPQCLKSTKPGAVTIII